MSQFTEVLYSTDRIIMASIHVCWYITAICVLSEMTPKLSQGWPYTVWKVLIGFGCLFMAASYTPEIPHMFATGVFFLLLSLSGFLTYLTFNELIFLVVNWAKTKEVKRGTPFKEINSQPSTISRNES